MSEQADDLMARLSRLTRGEHPNIRELRRQVRDGWLDDEIRDYWRTRLGLHLRAERELLGRARDMRHESDEVAIRGITPSALRHAFGLLAADPERKGKRPSRGAVAAALNTSEPTLERACKEGLDCHPWPGSLAD